MGVQPHTIKKLSIYGLVLGVAALLLSIVIGMLTESTFLSAIGTILLFLSIPTLLASAAVFVVFGGKHGYGQDPSKM